MMLKMRKMYQYFLKELVVLAMLGGAKVAGDEDGIGAEDEGINSTACR